jgi:hypothetical protein
VIEISFYGERETAPIDGSADQGKGEQSFARGRSYYNDGAILNPMRQGLELSAECQGSDYEPYQIRVTLDASLPQESYPNLDSHIARSLVFGYRLVAVCKRHNKWVDSSDRSYILQPAKREVLALQHGQFKPSV